MLEILVYIITGLLVILIPAIYIYRVMKKSRKANQGIPAPGKGTLFLCPRSRWLLQRNTARGIVLQINRSAGWETV